MRPLITTTALLQWYHDNNSDSDSSDNDGESEMKIWLRVLLHELQVIDARQVVPLWPKILETAIPIDKKTAQHALHPTDDEYLYTVN